MSMSAAPTTPKAKPVHVVAEHIEGLENQAVVQILIRPDDSIHVYPNPEVPVIVYHKDRGANPDYPELVRWVVKGLRGRMLKIEAKERKKAHLFPGSPFTIKGEDNTVVTVPTAGPGTWKYSIKLFDMHHRDEPISMLDPTIEVVEEP